MMAGLWWTNHSISICSLQIFAPALITNVLTCVSLKQTEDILYQTLPHWLSLLDVVHYCLPRRSWTETSGLDLSQHETLLAYIYLSVSVMPYNWPSCQSLPGNGKYANARVNVKEKETSVFLNAYSYTLFIRWWQRWWQIKWQRSSSVEVMRTAKSSDKSPGLSRGTPFKLHMLNGSKYYGSFTARVGTWDPVSCFVNNQPT